MQAVQTGLWSKSGQLATRARNPWRGHLENRHGREYPMSDQRGKVLSFGPFELSIGSRLWQMAQRYTARRARHGSPHRPGGASKQGRRLENPDRARLAKERSRTSQPARPQRDLIGPIYSRFTEGLATPDLILAKRMLEQTSAPARQAG